MVKIWCKNSKSTKYNKRKKVYNEDVVEMGVYESVVTDGDVSADVLNFTTKLPAKPRRQPSSTACVCVFFTLFSTVLTEHIIIRS